MFLDYYYQSLYVTTLIVITRYQKFKVALTAKKMGVTEILLELMSLQTKNKGVSNRLQRCYGNLLSEKTSITCSQIIGCLFDTTIKVARHKYC